MSAGGEVFLPDGSPLGNISANLGAYQAWANLTLSTVANAVNQQQAIDTLTQGNLTTQANLGAYQTWANLTLSTVANAVDQQSAINTLTSNAATQSTAISDLNANLGVIHLGNLSTQANLGAYQAWANLTLSTVANAVNQQQAIDDLNANLGTVVGTTIPALDANVGTLFLGNASTNANLGAYQSYGNLTFQTITNFNVLDANLGTVVGTTIPALDANLGTVVGTTIPALDANLGTVVGTTIPALDANVGTLFLGNVSTNANLGAYQTYANSTFSTVANASSQQTTIDGFDANIGTIVGITIPALDANLGTVVGTTIPAIDANLGTVVGTTIPALDANIGLQTINPVFTGQSLSITSGNIIAFNGNAVIYKATKPTVSTGAANDIPGMIAYDEFTDTMLLCVAPYDGTTNIWANVPAPRTTW
jgi:sortase (surface protein transpeptidase)